MEPYSKPALQHFFGRDKLALAQAPIEPPPVDAVEEKKPESHAVRNIAVGTAAASPFLGLIGQKKILHDPHINPNIRRFGTMTDLSREAKPGDVLLTTKPGGSVWKSTIQPLSGSEFYHAQPVVGRTGGHGTTLSAGQYDEPVYRRAMSNVKGDLENISEMSKSQGYPDIMLMRPKKKMSPEETKAFVQESMKRSRHKYDTSKAVSTWLRDIFVPKIGDKSKAKNPAVCEGNVCSTLPGMAYRKAGRSVLKEKRPEDIFPTDFLRSEDFEPVGVRLKSEYSTPTWVRKGMPLASRAGIGLALGAGMYGLSKDPALAAIPAGAYLGGQASDVLSSRAGLKTPPHVLATLAYLSEAKGKARNELLKSVGRHTAGSVIGGATAYGGTRAAQHLVKKFMQRKAEREAAQQQGR